MSIEIELKRIADYLERIAYPMQVPPVIAAEEAPDMLPASTKTGKTAKGKTAKGKPAPTKQELKPAGVAEPEVTEVTKEDITAVLQSFLKKFPGPTGAEKARAFFTAVGAKNITSLDPSKYKKVFLGLQQAMA